MKSHNTDFMNKNLSEIDVIKWARWSYYWTQQKWGTNRYNVYRNEWWEIISLEDILQLSQLIITV